MELEIEVNVKDTLDIPEYPEISEIEPPRLEREEQEDLDAPPKLDRGSMKLGESRDAFNKRRAMERADNKIQLENRAKELKEQLEKDAQKKQEYREKLYGK